MQYLQLNQFQELYLNGEFSEVVVSVNYTSALTLYNIAFIYSRDTHRDYKDVGYLISQKNLVRDFKSLDSCLRLLHFVDSFIVEDELYFRARSGQ